MFLLFNLLTCNHLLIFLCHSINVRSFFIDEWRWWIFFLFFIGKHLLLFLFRIYCCLWFYYSLSVEHLIKMHTMKAQNSTKIEMFYESRLVNTIYEMCNKYYTKTKNTCVFVLKKNKIKQSKIIRFLFTLPQSLCSWNESDNIRMLLLVYCIHVFVYYWILTFIYVLYDCNRENMKW